VWRSTAIFCGLGLKIRAEILPTGPNGERRPSDAIGAAVKVMPGMGQTYNRDAIKYILHRCGSKLTPHANLTKMFHVKLYGKIDCRDSKQC
jgi:hypothetical protein